VWCSSTVVSSPAPAPTLPEGATHAPTLGPTSAGTITVAVALTLATNATADAASEGGLLAAVADACGLPPAAIRSFTVATQSLSTASTTTTATTTTTTATTATAITTAKATAEVSTAVAAVVAGARRRLTTTGWSVSFEVVAVPADATALAASDGQSFAAAIAATLEVR